MYIKWMCSCGKTFISNTHRHHSCDICTKCHNFVDAEEYALRHSTGVQFMGDCNYDFLSELILDIMHQGLEIPIAYIEPLFDVQVMNQDLLDLEDEMLEDLK